MNSSFDVGIIGGGLAGLALSIQLSQSGYRVVLFEKETYPFHKVCGEYISLESWPFLESLGVPLGDMQLPIIKKLIVTAPNGTTLQQPLPLGGFGISRFTLDDTLRQIAVQKGVTIYEGCKVNKVSFNDNQFKISTAKGEFVSKVCCGSFGKRSNLDVDWQRRFILQKNDAANNYIGVKYHIKTNHPADSIALHNFKDGYCGMSKIEQDQYCLCYLTTAANLRANSNSITQLEENVLHRNKALAEVMSKAERLYASPLTIAQVSFSPKSQVHDHVLLLGDAAGMIAPLCGNGMSMALHGSKLAAQAVAAYLSGKSSQQQMEQQYLHAWRKTFANRLLVGRTIQRLFGKTWTTNMFVSSMKLMPRLTQHLIRQTHGEPF